VLHSSEIFGITVIEHSFSDLIPNSVMRESVDIPLQVLAKSDMYEAHVSSLVICFRTLGIRANIMPGVIDRLLSRNWKQVRHIRDLVIVIIPRED
jgi:hypothetical protein